MLVTPKNAQNVLTENQKIKLTYPSSKTGEPTPRDGRVEKIDHKNGLVVVEVEPAVFRSFKFCRIVGNIEII